MGIINFDDDVSKSINGKASFEDAIDDFLNKTNDSIPDYLVSLSKQMKAMFQINISPSYLAKEFTAGCDAISAELYRILNSWVCSISERAATLANNFTSEDLIHFYNEEPENIANLLVDSFVKYNDILLGVPKLADELKAFPPALKEVADASNKLYNDFDAVKKYVYAVCATLDIESDKFDKALSTKIISKAVNSKSAGDNDAQPTE